MSFSDLPRELRNMIYRGVLCPPDGVHLRHLDEHRRTRKFKADAGMEGSQIKDLNAREMIHLWPDMLSMWEMSSWHLSASAPVSTAIFYVNQQIRQEATEVFDAFNRFTFESSARAALHFLQSLPPSRRQHIKNLGFSRRSIAADDSDCMRSWGSLCDFIIHRMSVNSLTVQALRHHWLQIDETKPTEQAPNTGWYWWPAPRLFLAALMDGKIQQLRIACLATLRLGGSIQESQYQEAEHSRHKDPVECLEIISNLMYPRPREELEREALEGKALRRAIATGQPHEFDSMDALIADQETRRQRLNFVVTREDDPVGDLGTVLVLTGPITS